MLTKREAKFLVKLIDKTYMPDACEYTLESQDDNQDELEVEFREAYGMSRKAGIKAWYRIINKLYAMAN